jgi:PAS domain S-box-containing protein
MGGTPISVAFETRILCKDGTVKEAEARSTTIQYQGRPAVLSIVRDIAERKRAEEALKESEERYRLLAENVTDIIWTMDMNFRYTYLSPSSESRSGYTHEEAMAMTLEETFTPASVEAIQKAFSEELALERSGGRDRSVSRTLELEAYNKDGSTTWVEVVASFLRDAEGQPIGILGITRNIADRKRAENKLREAYDQETKLRSDLEGEMKKRVEFTRALVHELKTPLTSVIACSDLLTLELPEGPLLTMAKNISRSADNLSKRIDELLDLARGEMGMLRLSLACVDPVALLQGLAEEMGPIALSRHQSLGLDLPSCLAPAWADESRLRQIVLNFLENASKFTGEGGRITLRAREEGASLIAEVKDTGPGISEEERQRLFLPYHRLIGDRERLSGLGLGLALSKTLVELHGGKIWVKSHKGAGSTFGFSVPLATESQRG